MAEQQMERQEQKVFGLDAARVYVGDLSRPTMYGLDIPRFKIGRTRYYLREDLDSWLDERSAGGRND